MKIEELRSGDLVFVAGNSILADIIKINQDIENNKYGWLTHSTMVLDNNKFDIPINESIQEGVAISSLYKYINEKRPLYCLRYKDQDLSVFQKTIYELTRRKVGVAKYNFIGLPTQAWRFIKTIFNKNVKAHEKNTTDKFMCYSLSCWILYIITNNEAFNDWTNKAPIDGIESGLFDVSLLEY